LTLIPWLIWTAPLAGAVLTPAFAKIHPSLRNYGAVAFTLISAIFATLTAFTIAQGDYQVAWISSSIFNVNAGVLVDPLSMFLANIVAWISFLIMVYSLQYMKGEFGLTRYWFFMNLFIGNMLLLVLADNLLLMFFGWEGVGLCSYALIGHFYHDEPEHWVGVPGDTALGVPQAFPPSHAGMKAFVMTRIGDIALLIAIFLIFATAGTFNYGELATKLGQPGDWASILSGLGLLLPTALLFFGGPIGKSAQFPLQEWLPDAMAGPSSVSALIHAATMVKAGVFLVGRMGPIFYIALLQFNLVTPFFGTIAWIGAFTAFFAATQATVAREIKKVLAYSTVSQIGYMMMALGIAGLSANFIAGYSAGLLQLMSHAIFKASLFLAAGWVIHATETRFMDQMGGLAKAMRFTSISMILAGLSLIGIPPFSGFWTKDSILSSAFQSSQFVFYGIGLATVLLTAFYTTRMLGITFAGKSSSHVDELAEEGKPVHEADLIMLVPYLALAVASLGLGIFYPVYSGPLTNYIAKALPSALTTGSVPGLSTTELLLYGASIAMAGVGLALGYILYFRRPYVIPTRVAGLRAFLWHRWYLDALSYRVIVDGLTSASRGLYKYVEQAIWDKLSSTIARDVIDYSRASGVLDSEVVDGAVNDVATAGSRLSNLLRRLQSGVTEQYIISFAIGIALLLIYMIFVVGAR